MSSLVKLAEADDSGPTRRLHRGARPRRRSTSPQTSRPWSWIRATARPRSRTGPAGCGCPVEWHGGFAVTAAVFLANPGYRGAEFALLGASLARDGGALTARLIGDASRAGRHDEQALKRVWHYVARFGSPEMTGHQPSRARTLRGSGKGGVAADATSVVSGRAGARGRCGACPVAGVGLRAGRAGGWVVRGWREPGEVLAGGLGCWWWPVAAEDGLSVGAGGAGGSVGQEFDFPAHPVDADVMVVLAQEDAVRRLVLPPWRLCVTWWTSHWAGRRLQPPGQAQPLSRAMTALRIDSGMVSA